MRHDHARSVLHQLPQSAPETAGLALDRLDPDNVSADPEVWEKVVRKLRLGVMPPVGAPRPDRAAYDSLIDGVEQALDSSARRTAGRPLLHRLNRTEYANAIRDLLGLDVDGGVSAAAG